MTVYNFQHYKDRLLRLGIICLLLYGVLTLYRFYFLTAYVLPNSENASLDLVIRGFFLGFRFDSATIAYAMAIPFLLLLAVLLIGSAKWFRAWDMITRFWLGMIGFLMILVLVVDPSYFEFFHDHLNMVLFRLWEDDAAAVFSTIGKNYPVGWHLLLLALFTWGWIFISGKMLKTGFPGSGADKSPTTKIGWVIGPVFLFVLMARSSFGPMPINLRDAHYTNDFFLNKLAPNPVFTLEKGYEARREGKKFSRFWKYGMFSENIPEAFDLTRKYFISGMDQDLTLNESDPIQLINRTAPNIYNLRARNKPHIVLAIMEGFGSWILDYHNQDFPIAGGLEDWMKSGFYWENIISAGRRTVESLTGILLGIPPLPNALPLTQDRYSVVPFPSSLGHIFRDNGYETHFIYGGQKSWQRLEDFLPHQGFEHLYGSEGMDQSFERGDWGLFDEYLFDLAESILAAAKSPQLIVILTTTNHPPFQLPSTWSSPTLEIPPEIRPMIIGDPDLAENRFRAYHYSASIVCGFLESLQNSGLGDETITAVTGDHNFWGVRTYKDEEMLDHYRVPLLITGPEKYGINGRNFNAVGSHMDIGPTLIGLALPGNEYSSFGKDLLGRNEDSYVLNQDGLLITPGNIIKKDFATGILSIFSRGGQNLGKGKVELNGDPEEIFDAYFSAASYYMDWNWDLLVASIKNPRE